jgi:hypothetical protein
MMRIETATTPLAGTQTVTGLVGMAFGSFTDARG